MATEHVDVLIIGAGISGVGAAAKITEELPGTSVAILEARDAIGGTWDLFRYPGIRSDSDMFTFAYKWKPWDSVRTLADGADIRGYIQEAAAETGADRLVRYGHQVTAVSFDSTTHRWTVTASVKGRKKTLTASFLWNCTGYYDYDQGHQPEFPGLEDYEGTFIHPQFWPEDLDLTGKRAIVIGSGATAITLVPAMLKEGASHLTMLQRTPTYIISRPANDPLAGGFKRIPGLLRAALPLKGLRAKTAYEAIRWENIAITIGSYQFSRRFPKLMKKVIRDNQLSHLTAREGQPGFTRAEAEEIVAQHLTPPYNPWDQRLCVVPNGDLWKAMREGKADIVTDHIKTFAAKGIELQSGETLEADIVISATGLKVKLFGGLEVTVDGEKVDLSKTLSYKALMLSGLPNFAYTLGYTNASWTLKVDLVDDWVVGLLKEMREHGYEQVEVVPDPSVATSPLMEMASGYLQRALDEMPRKGDRYPWVLKQNYFVDMRTLADGDYHEEHLSYR